MNLRVLYTTLRFVLDSCNSSSTDEDSCGQHDFAYQILTSGGTRPSAEHAEWSPTGEYLLLRSSKELWLWKTPSRDGKDIVS